MDILVQNREDNVHTICDHYRFVCTALSRCKWQCGSICPMQWVVYILECADFTFYIGSTNDIRKRVHAHNSLKSGARYTKNRRPVRLAYILPCEDLSDARRREYALKQLTRHQKEELIRIYSTHEYKIE